MKARVKETGEIVEVHTHDDADFQDRQGRFYWEHQLFFGSLDVSPYDGPDYWTRLEHQYAGMAMQGILTNPIGFENIRVRGRNIQIETALLASEFAHALVEKLKSESNG